jgi:hypothetical protein
MAAKTEKRKRGRIVPEGSFSVYHQGQSCRLVDISPMGLGISYLGGEDWPESIDLEFSLSEKPEQKRRVRCFTVWEASMDFYRTRSEEIVRRRGLQFMEPGSDDVNELNRYLEKMTAAN